jgi:hypothetical protein
MRLVAIGIAALVLTVAACGDDDTAADDVDADTEGATDTDLQATRYTSDYQVCELVGRSARGELDHEFIDDSGITVDPVTDPAGYAQAWAERYRSEFQQSSFEGCLDGLEGNPPREPLP